LITVSWKDRWRHIRADIRLFRKALLRTGRRRVLAEWRTDLVSELDLIWEEVHASEGPVTPARATTKASKGRH
jgi:hypothetical protein